MSLANHRHGSERVVSAHVLPTLNFAYGTTIPRPLLLASSYAPPRCPAPYSSQLCRNPSREGTAASMKLVASCALDLTRVWLPEPYGEQSTLARRDAQLMGVPDYALSYRLSVRTRDRAAQTNATHGDMRPTHGAFVFCRARKNFIPSILPCTRVLLSPAPRRSQAATHS